MSGALLDKIMHQFGWCVTIVSIISALRFALSRILQDFCQSFALLYIIFTSLLVPTAAARSIPFIQRKACWCVQYKQFSVFSCWKIVLLGTLRLFLKAPAGCQRGSTLFLNEILNFANYPRFSMFPVTTILEVKNFFLQTADSNLQLFLKTPWRHTLIVGFKVWFSLMLLSIFRWHFQEVDLRKADTTSWITWNGWGGTPLFGDDCWWPGEGDLIIVYDWYILLKSLIYLNKWWHVTCA